MHSSHKKSPGLHASCFQTSPMTIGAGSRDQVSPQSAHRQILRCILAFRFAIFRSCLLSLIVSDSFRVGEGFGARGELYPRYFFAINNWHPSDLPKTAVAVFPPCADCG